MKKLICLSFCFLNLSILSHAQSQVVIDSLQAARITILEKKFEDINMLPTLIVLFVVIFGTMTVWNIFWQTKKLIEKKQEEVIKSATDQILDNLATQLGMPIIQVKKILEDSDKDKIIRSKRLMILSKSGEQSLVNLENLKMFTTKPDPYPYKKDLSINGYDVLIIDSLEINGISKDDILDILQNFDGKIHFVLAVKQGQIELDRQSYKSKIQFANDPSRFEAAIRSIFI